MQDEARSKLQAPKSLCKMQWWRRGDTENVLIQIPDCEHQVGVYNHQDINSACWRLLIEQGLKFCSNRCISNHKVLTFE